MVKILWGNRSQYDSKTREITIDRGLISEQDISRALEHEIDHYIISNRPLNLAYDLIVDNAFKWWKVPFFLAFFAFMIWAQYYWLPNVGFDACKTAYNDLALKCLNSMPSAQLNLSLIKFNISEVPK